MAEEVLEKVRKQIYQPENVETKGNGHNIGLSNIHQRIKLLFSEEYGLHIDSRPGKGTVVTMIIPWMQSMWKD